MLDPNSCKLLLVQRGLIYGCAGPFRLIENGPKGPEAPHVEPGRTLGAPIVISHEFNQAWACPSVTQGLKVPKVTFYEISILSELLGVRLNRSTP